MHHKKKIFTHVEGRSLIAYCRGLDWRPRSIARTRSPPAHSPMARRRGEKASNTAAGGIDWPIVTFVAGLIVVVGAFAIRHFFMVPVLRKGRVRWEWGTQANKMKETLWTAKEEAALQEQHKALLMELRGTDGVTNGTGLAWLRFLWKRKRRRPVTKQPHWAGKWERSLATSFTSCRKAIVGAGLSRWQQTCTPKPWTHLFPSGPLDCTFLGTDYGGFYLPNRMCFLNEPEPGRSHVAYGFGIGSDVSYDLSLASAYPNLVVRMFDPTPYAISHARAVMETIERGKPACDSGGRQRISAAACRGDYFGAIAKAKLRRSQFTVHPWAIGTSSGTLRFSSTSSSGTGSLYTPKQQTHPPQNRSGNSLWPLVRSDNLGRPPKPRGMHPRGKTAARRRLAAARMLELPVKTLAAIMHELGDTVVDILKLDIEGAEVEVVPQLLGMWRDWPKAQWPKVILLDMDSLRVGHPRRNVSGAKMVVSELTDAGYYLFAHPKKPDYSFVLPLSYRENQNGGQY